MEDKIKIIESDPSLIGIDENTIDLAIFRGAFFFPSLSEANLLEIHRVLKKGGVAFIGGGYGKYTPDLIIGEIGKKSKDLNLDCPAKTPKLAILAHLTLIMSMGWNGCFSSKMGFCSGLNLRLGKIHLNEKKLWQNIQSISLKGEVKLISEGGLWVLMKK